MDLNDVGSGLANGAPSSTTKPAAAGRSMAKRVLPARPVRAGVVIIAFTALLYLVEFVDLAFLHGSLNADGIRPRTLGGLSGVIWAPLLHQSWSHLVSNTIPVVVFGFLAMAGGLARFGLATALIWLVSGLGVWATAGSHTVTIGASGLAFGWLAFLLVRGIVNRAFSQVVVALLLLFYWGSMLGGLLPGEPHISWQGHLFGAIGGILAALLFARGGARKTSRKVTGKGSEDASQQLPGNVTV